MYGVKVTTPIRSSYSIVDGEISEIDYFKYNEEERQNIYRKFTETQPTFGGTIDIFTDGCYITSYARFMLVSMMTKLVDEGCNVVYSDTDSIKFYLNNTSEDNIFAMINKTNWLTVKSNKKNIRFKTFKEQFNINDQDYEKICKLGIWEMETVDENDQPKPLPYFITFGAKKYGYIDNNGKVHLRNL